ncbi:MAG: flavodoxin family protein [Lachnospiraceae bacterium]|nr:flavodoxin family protein [Lachnospiraceae bacterium]
MLEYAVLYYSETGNTSKIAAEIFSSLPGQSKDLIKVDMGKPIPQAKNYFVGFFVNKGTCNMEVADVLSEIHDAKVAIFATCGANPIKEYKDNVERKVKVWIDDDNDYEGFFLCQGKMKREVREKYEEMITSENEEKIRVMLHNYEEAKLHPSSVDLERAREFVEQIICGRSY